MAFCDFVVKFDEEKEEPEELTKRILYSIYIKRLAANKPAITFIGGDSGEGKSFSALRLIELLYDIQGVDVNEFFEVSNVFTPLQYPEKIEKILFDKKYKKANLVCLHEAREVIKAKLWHSFITQAVADVNAMSRSIKRLGVFIISQFIRDITNDMRYTLNYYCIVRRPKGKRARLYINVLWKDDRDLEKPKLRKRKLSGYIVDKKGRYKRFVPQYLEMKKPSKEICELFDKLDTEAKSGIIKTKLARLMEEMQSEVGAESVKVEAMVNWYMKNPENLHTIGRRRKGKYIVKGEVQEMHGLSKDETVKFQNLLNKRLKEKGMIENVDRK